MLFEELILKMRHKKAITQAELSKIMGVNQSLISFYERGEKKPGMKTLKKFVDKANKEFKMKITYSDIEI